VTISDGLRHAFSDPVSRTIGNLDRAIAELTQWADCKEIQTIQSIQVKNSVLSGLTDSYNYALTALRKFEFEFERITGIRRSPTDLIKLFNIELNSNKFSLIHPHPFINTDDEKMLSLSFIINAIDELKTERELLSQYGWNELPVNWAAIKAQLEQRQKRISPDFIEVELRDSNVLYDYHISFSGEEMMISGLDANNGYRIALSSLSQYDQVTGIGRIMAGDLFRVIGSDITHVN